MMKYYSYMFMVNISDITCVKKIMQYMNYMKYKTKHV